MPVDSSGFKKKMKLARSNFDKVGPMIIEDAATYLLLQLVEDVLNGETGTNYPKSYPSTISQGATGFVGVITSNLRRSMDFRKLDKYTAYITNVRSGLAPYHNDVIEWSKNRYGKDFYEITVQLYGKQVIDEIAKALTRMLKSWNDGREFQYTNQFPG